MQTEKVQGMSFRGPESEPTLTSLKTGEKGENISHTGAAEINAE